MVEQRGELASEWVAISSIGSKMVCTAEILRSIAPRSTGSAKLAGRDLDRQIEGHNAELAAFRAATGDMFLTSFKDLRADSCYRRRLDWATARALIERCLA